MRNEEEGIRDLAHKNKRKRKEPSKPWGKKERMIVLFALGLTVLIAIVLSFDLSKFNFTFPKINFGSFNLFQEKTIIIEK